MKHLILPVCMAIAAAAAVLSGAVALEARGQDAPKTMTGTIDPAKTKFDISLTMYGVFFEDINFAADGGLYAELIKNRSFEFPNGLSGWETDGMVEVIKGREGDVPFPRNTALRPRDSRIPSRPLDRA